MFTAMFVSFLCIPGTIPATLLTGRAILNKCLSR